MLSAGSDKPLINCPQQGTACEFAQPSSREMPLRAVLAAVCAAYDVGVFGSGSHDHPQMSGQPSPKAS
jgi:hypothetical protein